MRLIHCIGFSIFTSLSLEVSYAVQQPEVIFQPSGSSFDWDSQSGRTYFIEWGTDLTNWTFFPTIRSGNGNTLSHGFNTDAPDVFMRLRWTDAFDDGNPETKDFDNDGLSSLAELINPIQTNPLDSDTDDDGLNDGFELRFGFSPVVGDENNNGTLDGQDDSDGDGASNEDEQGNGGNPNDAIDGGEGATVLTGEGAEGEEVITRRTYTIPAGGKSYLVGAYVHSTEYPTYTSNPSNEFNDRLRWKITPSNGSEISNTISVNTLHSAWEQAEAEEAFPISGFFPVALQSMGIVNSDPEQDVTVEVEIGITNIEDRAFPSTAIINLLPVEIKVTSQNSPTGSEPKYSSTPRIGNADNLFSVWPDEELVVNVNIDEAIELPDDTIQWNVPGQSIPGNTREWNFSWPTEGTKWIEIDIAGKLFKIWVDVPHVGDVGQVAAAANVTTLPPWATAQIGSWAIFAQNYANQNYENTPRRDAIRHSYWCSLSVSDGYVTQDHILYFSTAHEFDNKHDDQQQAFNSTMDLWNNHVGSLVDLSFPTIPPTPKTTEILAALENAYDSGGLRIYDGETSQGDSEGIMLKSDGTKIYPVN